jgi:hypothetical protein
VTVHFIRIGKTASTALSISLRPLFVEGSPTYGEVRQHPHSKRVPGIPRGEKLFFTLRDPVTRFVSGFSSRLREGKPRYDRPWSPEEKIAFARFSRPEELAHALVSEDADDRAAARYAFRHIRQLNRQYTYWLRSPEVIEERLDDIVMILRQETLDQDVQRLVEELGYNKTVTLEDDPVRAHRSPDDKALRSLDDRAVAALRGWFAPSYELLDCCEAIRRDRGWAS